MDPCTGKYYSEDDSFKETARFPADIFDSGKCFYEVLRVINGACIFLADHLKRLNNSIRLAGLPVSSNTGRFREIIGELIRRNNLVDGNIRLIMQLKEMKTPVWYSCCVPFSYPDAGQYRKGVSTAVFRKVREQPNIKQYYPSYHLQMLDFISVYDIYEALLMDDRDFITEGSKSNVFFISQNQFYTAPGEVVLKGITREKIIMICNKLKYNLIEKAISIHSINAMEAVFITGTSPKVLPVRAIDDTFFPVDNPMMRKIMVEYDELIRLDGEHYFSG